MKWKKLILLFFLILITACAVNTPLEEPNTEIEQAEEEISGEELEDNYLVDHQLVDREWILLSLDGGQLIEGTNIILAFDESSFSGFAGCNGYGGPYESEGDGKILFVEYSSQAEGCIEPEGVLDQEIKYLKQLMEVDHYQVDGGVLTLSVPGGEQELIYSLREPFEIDPELLNNSSWQLLPSDDFSLIEGTVITISFLDGKMQGAGGCRNYQGEYQAEGDQARFPLTMMIGEVCADQDLLIQEAKFTTALELASHYQIVDDQLMLYLVTGEELLFMRIE